MLEKEDDVETRSLCAEKASIRVPWLTPIVVAHQSHKGDAESMKG